MTVNISRCMLFINRLWGLVNVLEIYKFNFYCIHPQHQVSYYAQKMSHGFLKRPPEYNFPTSPKGPPPDVDGLKPTLSSVVLHRHGDELAVTVEGSNLWFSYQISLHDTEKISIPGDESNGTSIQYNLSGDQEDKITVEEAKVKVFLHTRFSSKPVKEHVPVHKKVVKSDKYIHSYVVQVDL